MRRQAIIGVVAFVAALSALTGVAAADGPAKPQANSSVGNSFEGTCRLTGGFNLTTPLGGLPRPTTFTGIGTGTCTGSVNGGPSKDHPTVNQISGIGTLS